MQLLGYESECELGRQVARDVVLVAETGPEVGKGVNKVGPHLEVDIPLVCRTGHCPTNESEFLVVYGDIMGAEAAV